MVTSFIANMRREEVLPPWPCRAAERSMLELLNGIKCGTKYMLVLLHQTRTTTNRSERGESYRRNGARVGGNRQTKSKHKRPPRFYYRRWEVKPSAPTSQRPKGDSKGFVRGTKTDSNPSWNHTITQSTLFVHDSYSAIDMLP